MNPALLFVVCATLASAVESWRRGRRETAALTLAVVGGGTALSMALKVIVGRIRPSAAEALVPLPVTHGFPSGHAMVSLCFAIAVGIAVSRDGRFRRFRRLIYACLAVCVFGVGFSRAHLGVHWSSDIFGSWIIGGVFVIAVVAADRAWAQFRGLAAGGS